jgi:hypothetical protein
MVNLGPRRRHRRQLSRFVGRLKVGRMHVKLIENHPDIALYRVVEPHSGLLHVVRVGRNQLSGLCFGKLADIHRDGGRGARNKALDGGYFQQFGR